LYSLFEWYLDLFRQWTWAWDLCQAYSAKVARSKSSDEYNQMQVSHHLSLVSKIDNHHWRNQDEFFQDKHYCQLTHLDQR